MPPPSSNTLPTGDVLHLLDLNMESFLAADPPSPTSSPSSSSSSTHHHNGQPQAHQNHNHHHHHHRQWKSVFDVKRNGMGINTGPSLTPSIDALVDNDQGLLIVHPDVLISPTKVAEAIGCNRRGVLSDRIRSFGGTNEAAVMGNLKHLFIETAVEMCLDRLATQQRQQNQYQQQQQQQQHHQQQQQQHHQQQQPQPHQQQSTAQPRPYPPPLHPSSSSSSSSSSTPSGNLISESEVAELISTCIASNLLDIMAVGLTDANVETELRAGKPITHYFHPMNQLVFRLMGRQPSSITLCPFVVSNYLSSSQFPLFSISMPQTTTNNNDNDSGQSIDRLGASNYSVN